MKRMLTIIINILFLKISSKASKLNKEVKEGQVSNVYWFKKERNIAIAIFGLILSISELAKALAKKESYNFMFDVAIPALCILGVLAEHKRIEHKYKL